MTPEDKLITIEALIQEWVNAQGHDKCWYYPDLFQQIADVLELKVKVPMRPNFSKEEFKCGCDKFTEDLYGMKRPYDESFLTKQDEL